MIKRLLRFRHFLLLLAFIPYALWMRRAPAAADDADLALFAPPGETPFLAAGSQMHWLLAAASAALYFTAAILLFDRRRVRPTALLAAGAFTGTLGIILLLLFQRFAASPGQVPWSLDSDTIILRVILAVIAACYRAVNDNQGDLAVQLVAYTFSVGLCEEITKLLPVLFAPSRWQPLTAADARVVGFMSGAGFGVAEGIVYSQRQYNGHEPALTYAVRFLSVVAMHAIASAAAAGLVVRHEVTQEDDWHMLVKLVWVILPVMALHALYDVFCDRSLSVWALIAILTLFALLAYQIAAEPRRPVALAR